MNWDEHDRAVARTMHRTRPPPVVCGNSGMTCHETAMYFAPHSLSAYQLHPVRLLCSDCYDRWMRTAQRNNIVKLLDQNFLARAYYNDHPR